MGKFPAGRKVWQFCHEQELHFAGRRTVMDTIRAHRRNRRYRAMVREMYEAMIRG
jgi:hypothetical protein